MSQHPPTYRKWNWLLTWWTSILILLQDASRWAACSSASRFVRYCVRTKKYLPRTTKNIWNFTRNTQLLCVLLCCASETKAVMYGNPLLFAARKDWHDSEKIWTICGTKAILAVLCPPSIPQPVWMELSLMSDPPVNRDVHKKPAWNQGFWIEQSICCWI